MALVKTQLTSAITSGQLVFGVASTATGFPGVGIFSNPQQPLMVDQEMMFLVQVLSPGVIQVRSRGSDGRQAVAHDITAPVITSSSPSDFPLPGLGEWIINPIESNSIVTYGQSGTIVQPTAGSDATALLNGATAITMTLAAPNMAAMGVLLRISTGSAFAHVVSAPGLFLTGAAGGPFSTLTFPAQIGAWVDLVAENQAGIGQWSVNGTNGAVIFT
jgi:hypothetical protein